MPAIARRTRGLQNLIHEGIAVLVAGQLDDPEVGIARHRTLDVGVGLGLRHDASTTPMAGAAADPLSHEGNIAGTPRAMAPEQAVDSASVDEPWAK